MIHHLMQLTARIRAICIVFALLMVPGMVQAYDVYMLTSQTINGKEGSYDMSHSEHKFTQSSGTEYTYTINSMPTGGTFSFRIGVGGWDNNLQPYNDGDALNINGSSYTISKDCYGKTNAWKVSYKEGEYSSLTITVDISDNTDKRYVKITGVKSSSSGGGTKTSANQPGIYLYGQNFGSTDPNKHLTYKFLRKNDSEYHFALYAGSMKFSVEKYEQDRGKLDITPSWNNWQFKIAYIDADGNVSTFCPPSNYTLTNTDGTASTSKEFGNNTQWTIQDNGGMYDLVVKVDANGKPTSWYYESDPNRIVSYKASSTSNWTTEGFRY